MGVADSIDPTPLPFYPDREVIIADAIQMRRVCGGARLAVKCIPMSVMANYNARHHLVRYTACFSNARYRSDY
jgi:hypothetical protein